MDLVLDWLDENYLDALYSTNLPEAYHVRDYWLRQYITILFLWTFGGWMLYLSIASLSYFIFFDKRLKNHKLYLPNQIQQEISVAVKSIPLMAIPSSFIFLAEVRGWSKLYESLDAYGGMWYIILTIPLYLLFTDTCIYWIHKWLHLPIFYGPIHKTHHRWIVSTPFASHAFHPADGFLQSLPYHIYVFLIPLNKYVYLLLFFFVNMWTISIHDNVHIYDGKVLNGAEHHTIHHRQYYYNYGQYFTFWDRLCGTHKLPSKEEKLE